MTRFVPGLLVGIVVGAFLVTLVNRHGLAANLDKPAISRRMPCTRGSRRASGWRSCATRMRRIAKNLCRRWELSSREVECFCIMFNRWHVLWPSVRLNTTTKGMGCAAATQTNPGHNEPANEHGQLLPAGRVLGQRPNLFTMGFLACRPALIPLPHASS